MERTIAIVAPSAVPFQIGGAEKFWLGLHRALASYSGCAVELIKLPCPESTFPEVVQSYKTFSGLDLAHFDMVISSKYPAWMVPHHNHVVYLQHTLRERAGTAGRTHNGGVCPVSVRTGNGLRRRATAHSGEDSEMACAERV
ncbi:MAG: hypothetical protein IJU76_15845 [Desulfovibrionaceae bacterium]|nr:hypothetical protein [Desulfovibrionaceae bacterium]